MLGGASRRTRCRWSAFRPQRFRRCHFRGRHGGQGVQRGQKFQYVQVVKKIRGVQTWLLLPADIQEARSRADQHVCREEWREYQKERRRQEEEKHNAREKREEEREELKRRQKERPEVATVRLTRHGISVPNIARHFLKDQEREEKAALRDRQAQRKQQERIPRFKHWLG